jgi:serine/threonine protein kinase
MDIYKNISDSLKKSLSKTDIYYTGEMIRDLKPYGFIFEKILGVGGFCVVGLFKKNKKKYAVKIYNNEKLSDNLIQQIADINNHFDRFIKKCKENSKFVLNYKMFFLEGNYYVLSEPLDTSLIDYMSKKDSTKNKFKVICQMIKALSCLHNMGIIHGDLKPDNIFIKKSKHHIKIGDFDGVGIVSKKEVMIYTSLYLHPSVKNIKDYSFTFSDDIFAIGIIIVIMFDKDVSNYIYDIETRLNYKQLGELHSIVKYSSFIPNNIKPILIKMLSKKESDINRISDTFEGVCHLFKRQFRNIPSFKINNIRKPTTRQKKTKMKQK